MLSSNHIDQNEIARRESFLRDNTRPFVLIDPTTWPRSWATAFGAMFGGTIAWKYYAEWSRQPYFYGLVPRAAALGFLGLVGFGVGSLREYHYKTRDAVIEHYLSLHPGDFTHLTSLDGRKYSEVLMPWIPRRAHHRKFE